MRFTVSDSMDLEHGFGKWSYSHHEGVRRWSDGDRVCLYYGYSLDGELDQLVRGDTGLIPEANGKFCVVVLWRDRLEVHIDYFCQSKVYYHTRDGLTVTNEISSLPLTQGDLDGGIIKKFARGLYGGKVGTTDDHQRSDVLLKQWETHTEDHTVFKAVASVPRGHYLRHAEGRTETVLVHDHTRDTMAALAAPLHWSTARLEDQVHQCMEQHSDVIKRHYNNICSTVSDGVDSVLQDMYFDRASRLMYHPGAPNDSLRWKEQIIAQLRDRGVNVRLDVMPEQVVGDLTLRHATDVNLSWLDLVPTLWQMDRSLTHRPDVIMYGQGGDETFMHRTGFVWSMVPRAQRPEYRHTYGGSEHRPSALYSDDDAEPWQSRIARQTRINLYNRDIENQTGVQTTSLYSDRRTFNLVRRMPSDVMLDSMANAGPQRRLLRDRFDFEFRTTRKDAAGYRCAAVLKALLSLTTKI
jgi:asparagine synthetase B (glutamine-hydrolysing)